MSTRRQRAGQGTVELALGTVLVVSTLLLATYLAEVGFLSLKVQEAGNFAALKGTGERVHDFSNPSSGGDYQPLNGMGASLASTAQARYRDFDGTTATGGPTQVTQVFTRADNLTVSCQQTAAGGPQFPFPSGGGRTGAQLRTWYQNRGGVSCSAQARISDIRLPSRYLDGPRGLSQERLQAFAPMTVCAIGRTLGGSCRGRYSLLLGDWSLDGPLNSDLSADFPFERNQDDAPSSYTRTQGIQPPVRNDSEPRNLPYWQMARELFVLSGAPYHAGQGGHSASMQFADAMEPWRHFNTTEQLYNERQPSPLHRPSHQGEDFAFSYAGPERGSQDVFPTTCPPCHFNTNGTATVDGPRENRPLWLRHRWNKDKRHSCFLGLEGCN